MTLYSPTLPRGQLTQKLCAFSDVAHPMGRMDVFRRMCAFAFTFARKWLFMVIGESCTMRSAQGRVNILSADRAAASVPLKNSRVVNEVYHRVNHSRPATMARFLAHKFAFWRLCILSYLCIVSFSMFSLILHGTLGIRFSVFLIAAVFTLFHDVFVRFAVLLTIGGGNFLMFLIVAFLLFTEKNSVFLSISSLILLCFFSKRLLIRLFTGLAIGLQPVFLGLIATKACRGKRLLTSWTNFKPWHKRFRRRFEFSKFLSVSLFPHKGLRVCTGSTPSVKLIGIFTERKFLKRFLSIALRTNFRENEQWKLLSMRNRSHGLNRLSFSALSSWLPERKAYIFSHWFMRPMLDNHSYYSILSVEGISGSEVAN